MQDEINWLSVDDATNIHLDQITRYGGPHGILSLPALESTLARPKNLAGYSHPDIFDLAACYAFGFARNHCFVDGNKRVALAASSFFLLDHSFVFAASIDEAVENITNAATGRFSEEDLANWFRRMSVTIPLGRV